MASCAPTPRPIPRRPPSSCWRPMAGASPPGAGRRCGRAHGHASIPMAASSSSIATRMRSSSSRRRASAWAASASATRRASPSTRPATSPSRPTARSMSPTATRNSPGPPLHAPRARRSARWGAPGHGPGRIPTPHSVWVMPDGRVAVADRENNRVQVFTPEGALARGLARHTTSRWTCMAAPDGGLLRDRPDAAAVAASTPRASWSAAAGRC